MVRQTQTGIKGGSWRRRLDGLQRVPVAVKRKSRLIANLQSARRVRSSAKAAALVNVSPRLISYAIKVLRDGYEELIAAVESGATHGPPATGHGNVTPCRSRHATNFDGEV